MNDADSGEDLHDMFDVVDGIPVIEAENEDFEVKSNTFESPKNTSGGAKEKRKSIVKQKILGEEEDEDKKDLNSIFDISGNDASNIEEETKEEKDPKEILKQKQPIAEPKENVMNISTPKAKLNDSSFMNKTMSRLYRNYSSVGKGEFVVNKGYQRPENADMYCVTDYSIEFDHHKYLIKGIDPFSKQPFEIWRRFRHFYILRECLMLKFPAFYMPPLPEKKLLDNKSEDNARERLFVLNRFVKQFTLCPYLLESDEFRIFIHPQQDIEKQLQFVTQNNDKGITSASLLESVDPYFYVKGRFAENEIEKANYEINEFTVIAKRMYEFLNKFIEVISSNEKKFQ